MSVEPFTDTPDGVILTIRVIPRAARSGPAGLRDGAILVRLGAAPVEGAANSELIEILADLFDVPKRHVTIVSGQRSRLKRVHVIGVTAQDARELLIRDS